MTDTDMLKICVQRETELEKRRTVALARQQWLRVIECEAALEEWKLWRKQVAERALTEVELPQVRDGLKVTGAETGRTPT